MTYVHHAMRVDVRSDQASGMLRILTGLHQLANKMVCGMNGMINVRTNAETLVIDAIAESDSTNREGDLRF